MKNNISVKDFLMFSWVFPYTLIYEDWDCAIAKGKNSRDEDTFVLVYRAEDQPSGFTQVPFPNVRSENMIDEMVYKAAGRLTHACKDFLRQMVGA